MAENVHDEKTTSPSGTVNGDSHGSSHHNTHYGYEYAPSEGRTLHPGQWKPYEHRKFANPAPLGLAAFALTTFVLSCVNMETRHVKVPEIVVPLAFGYGGLVQLLAGMWYVFFFLPFVQLYEEH